MTTAAYAPAPENQTFSSKQLPLLLGNQRRKAAQRHEFHKFWVSVLLPVSLQLGLSGRELAMAQLRAWARWRRDLTENAFSH